jgi:micrococcal nuclease
MNQKVIITSLLSIAGIIGIVLLILGLSPNTFSTLIDGIDQVITPRKTYGIIQDATIERVVDGDTVKLQNGDTVRLLNIDTPETVKENTPVMCYGKPASDFAKVLMDKQQVVLRFDKEQRDKYGRLLAFIFPKDVDNTLVENSYNSQLVKLGYARSLVIKPNVTQARYFRKLEKDARDQNLGVWGACPKPFVE